MPLTCPFRAITGVPCPGCGMTGLADGVVHGDVLGAMAADPLGGVLLVAIAALAIVGVAARAGLAPRVPPGRVVPVALLAVLLVRWALALAGAVAGLA